MRLRTSRRKPGSRKAEKPPPYIAIRILGGGGHALSAVVTAQEMDGPEGRWMLEAKACALAGAYWERFHEEPASG